MMAESTEAGWIGRCKFVNEGKRKERGRPVPRSLLLYHVHCLGIEKSGGH